MPELPEVEVVRSGLAAAVTGARVAGVDVLDMRALSRHAPLRSPDPADDFAARLVGARLAAPARRGKFLWVQIDGRDEALLAHLGMSG
ncbi:MAG: DNA-formamidopyrimidine glycosylase, partial [Actinobacteria bacterium]|nr:DNA-formamidopyrimidine glycosylase [Actinomycetota bacterium]